MNWVFRTLIEITVYSGIVFAAIMIFKNLFKNKISPKLHFFIWALLLMRLMIPITFESGFHFVNIPQEPIIFEGKSIEPLSDAPVAIATDTSKKANIQTQIHTQKPINKEVETTENFAKTPVFNWSIQNISVYIWLVGMAICSFMFLFTYNKLLKITKQLSVKPTNQLLDLLDDCKFELGIYKNVCIKVQRNLASPAILFPNVILVPMDILKLRREEIRMVLLHELTHFKRRDHGLNMILLILRTVYWFNPFVWLAVKQIRVDIETACDNDVVRHWQLDERNYYAHTVLTMFERASCNNMVLDMACKETRKNAEQRIRGIYMKSKTKLSIKAIAVAVACIVGICCFTTACQPTPENPVISGKNDGELLEKIKGSNNLQNSKIKDETSQMDLYSVLDAPKLWQEKITDNMEKPKIIIDAPITLPNTNKIPVATVKRRIFTQEEVNKVGEVIFGKNAVYTQQENLTKEFIEKEILENQHFLEELKNGEHSSLNEEKDFYIEKTNATITSYKDMYETAPAEADLGQIDLTLKEITNTGNLIEMTMGVSATTIKDEEVFTFGVINDLNDIVEIRASNDFFGGSTYVDEPYKISLTKDQAAQIAIPIAAQLTDELVLKHVGVYASKGEKSERKWGWACVFTRTINQTPTTYTTDNVGGDMESELKAPVAYEEMVISMDDKGIIGFSWVNPLEITKIENENVELLPFSDIKDIAIMQLKARHAEYTVEDENNYITVTGMELGLMRVDKQNSQEYYYLPVWDIYSEIGREGVEPLDESIFVDANGTATTLISGFAPKTYNSITINAIDGSILNRYIGN